METALAVFFAALFLVALMLQTAFVLRALTLLRTQPDMRLLLNYILLLTGVITAVLAAGFAVLFGVIAFTN